MTHEEIVFEVLEQSGLNWSIDLLPLTGPNGQETGSFGTFTKDSGEWLGTHGAKYHVVQNSELADLFVKASKGILDSADISGGYLKGKRRVYLQAKLDDAHIGNSGVKRNLTMMSSHDGTTSVGFGSSNTVIVCDNAFYRAFRDVWKFKHTENAMQRLEAVVLDFNRALKHEETLMYNFEKMSEIKVKNQQIKSLVETLFTVDPDASIDSVSTRKRNNMNDFSACIEKEFDLEGATLWGLFNGVTRYTNHVLTPRGSQTKEDFLMIGSGEKFNTVGYEEIMKFVEEHTQMTSTVSVN